METTSGDRPQQCSMYPLPLVTLKEQLHKPTHNDLVLSRPYTPLTSKCLESVRIISQPNTTENQLEDIVSYQPRKQEVKVSSAITKQRYLGQHGFCIEGSACNRSDKTWINFDLNNLWYYWYHCAISCLITQLAILCLGVCSTPRWMWRFSTAKLAIENALFPNYSYSHKCPSVLGGKSFFFSI